MKNFRFYGEEEDCQFDVSENERDIFYYLMEGGLADLNIAERKTMCVNTIKNCGLFIIYSAVMYALIFMLCLLG